MENFDRKIKKLIEGGITLTENEIEMLRNFYNEGYRDGKSDTHKLSVIN